MKTSSCSDNVLLAKMRFLINFDLLYKKVLNYLLFLAMACYPKPSISNAFYLLLDDNSEAYVDALLLLAEVIGVPRSLLKCEFACPIP